jgi:hypothetical protein
MTVSIALWRDITVLPEIVRTYLEMSELILDDKFEEVREYRSHLRHITK